MVSRGRIFFFVQSLQGDNWASLRAVPRRDGIIPGEVVCSELCYYDKGSECVPSSRTEHTFRVIRATGVMNEAGICCLAGN